MSLLEDYRNEWRKRNWGSSILFSIDKAIIKSAQKQGYSIESIINAIKTSSPILKNKTNEQIEAYIKQLPCDLSITPSAVKTKLDYLSFRKRFEKSILKKYTAIETEIAEALIKKGYKNLDVQYIIKDNSPYFKYIHSKEDALDDFSYALYKNFPLTEKGHHKYEEMVSEYKKQAEAIKNRYQGEFNRYYEGKILIDFMMNRRVPIVYLEKLLLESVNEKAGKDKEAYAASVASELKEVQRAYKNIAEFKHTDSKKIEDSYLSYIHQYMKATKKSYINGRDEQQIVKRLFAENFTSKDIESVLLKFSPVAKEPGRNPDNYVKNTVEIVNREYQQKIQKAKEHMEKVSRLFDEELAKINEKYAKAQKYNEKNNISKIVYYGFLAKKLLDKFCYPDYIVDNFTKKIPELKAKISNSNDNYIYALVKAAQNSKANEKAITEYISPYKFYEMSLEDIKAKNIPLTDVYRSIIKERINIYPDTVLNLTKPHIDKDACVKMINRYPDITDDDLIKAVKEASVYNKLLDVDAQYAQNIVKTARESLTQSEEYIKENREHEKELENDFNLYKDVASGGIERNEREQKEYCDCKATITMIKNDVNEVDIKNLLANDASQEDLTDKYKYADMIYDSAKKVVAREIQIMNNLVVNKEPEFLYKNYMKKEFLKKNYFSPAVDVEAAKNMMFDKVPKEQIEITIVKHSPIMAEPNRDIHYAKDFVLKKAEIELAAEKRKLLQYQPHLREEKDIDEAYKNHYRDYSSFINLPFDRTADLIIAGAMLAQGFKTEEIAASLTRMSPLSIKAAGNLENSSYGKNIINEVQQKQQEQQKSQELGIVLERTIEKPADGN